VAKKNKEKFFHQKGRKLRNIFLKNTLDRRQFFVLRNVRLLAPRTLFMDKKIKY
jgi:hypothetical protein